MVISLDQLGIAAFGVTAIALSQSDRDSVRRWACVAGLCAQPFWFWTTAAHEQWAIFGLSFLYTAAWLRGARTYWWHPIRLWLVKSGLRRPQPSRCYRCAAPLTANERQFYGRTCERCEGEIWQLARESEA